MEHLDYLACVPSTGTPVLRVLAIEEPERFRWGEACDLLMVGLGCADTRWKNTGQGPGMA